MTGKEKSRRWKIEIALLGATAIMLVGILGAWGYAYNLNRTVERALVDSSQTPSAEPAEEEKSAEPQPGAQATPGRSGPSGSVRTQLPEEIKKLVDAKKFFGAPSTSVRVQGVLGNAALINNQWMEVDEEKKGIRLLEITDDKVIMEVFGKRREMPIWPDLPKAGQPALPSPAVARATPASGNPEEPTPQATATLALEALEIEMSLDPGTFAFDLPGQFSGNIKIMTVPGGDGHEFIIQSHSEDH